MVSFICNLKCFFGVSDEPVIQLLDRLALKSSVIRKENPIPNPFLYWSYACSIHSFMSPTRKWLTLLSPWLQWANKLIWKMLMKAQVRHGFFQFLKPDPVKCHPGDTVKALLLLALQQKQIKGFIVPPEGEAVVSLPPPAKKSKTPSQRMKAKPRWVSCRQKAARWVFFLVCFYCLSPGVLMHVILRFIPSLIKWGKKKYLFCHPG